MIWYILRTLDGALLEAEQERLVTALSSLIVGGVKA